MIRDVAALALLLWCDSAAGQQPWLGLAGSFAIPDQVITAGDALHAFVNEGGSLQTVTYHRSLDNGRSWEPGRLLASNVLAANSNFVGNGGWLMFSIGSANGPAVIASRDGGSTWSAPVRVSASSTVARVARLFFSQGVLLAFWSEPRIGPGDVYVARSLDGGATWSSEVRLDTATPDRDSRSPWTFGDASALYVSWAEWQVGSSQQRVSLDLGLSWLPVAPRLALVPRSAVALGPIVLACLLNTLQRSTDYGFTWTNTAWQPGANPVLAMDGQNAIAIWSAGSSIMAANSIDAGVNWSVAGNWPLPGTAVPLTYQATIRGTCVALTLHWQVAPQNFAANFALSSDLGSTWRYSRLATNSNSPTTLGNTFAIGDGFLACMLINGRPYTTPLCGHQPYGLATPGAAAIEPALEHAGIPFLGQPVSLSVTRAVGGAPAILAGTFAGPASQPIGGATLLLSHPLVGIWLTTSGAVGLPGVGTATTSFTVPATANFMASRTNWQAFVLDGAAASGFSATRGLELWTH